MCASLPVVVPGAVPSEAEDLVSDGGRGVVDPPRPALEARGPPMHGVDGPGLGPDLLVHIVGRVGGVRHGRGSGGE